MKPPTIETARRIGKQHEATRVVLFVIDDETGDFAQVSYGKDRAHCDSARRLADRLAEHVV